MSQQREQTAPFFAFPITSDAVNLAKFASRSIGGRAVTQSVIELGCGGGGVLAELLKLSPGITAVGFDISEQAVSHAREYLSMLGLSERSEIYTGDLRDVSSFRAGVYDICIFNPPYYAQGAGRLPRSAVLHTAKHEEHAALVDYISAAARAIKPGGRAVFCIRPFRLAEAFRLLSRENLEPKKMRVSQKLALIDAKLFGKPGLELELQSDNVMYSRDNGGIPDE